MILRPSLLTYLPPKYPPSVPLASCLAVYLTVVTSWMPCLWVSPQTAEQIVFNMESASYLCQWCWRLMVLQIMSFIFKKKNAAAKTGAFEIKGHFTKCNWTGSRCLFLQWNCDSTSIFCLFIFWMITLRMQISEACYLLVLLWHKCEYRASCIHGQLANCCVLLEMTP